MVIASEKKLNCPEYAGLEITGSKESHGRRVNPEG